MRFNRKVISFFLALVFIVASATEALAIPANETGVASAVLLTEGNMNVKSPQYGVGPRTYYEEFSDLRSGVDVWSTSGAFLWETSGRRHQPNTIRKNIKIERVADETDGEGGRSKTSNAYRTYKITYFPNRGIVDANDNAPIQFRNLNMGFGMTKDLQFELAEIRVTFGDTGDTSTKVYYVGKDSFTSGSGGLINMGSPNRNYPGMANARLLESEEDLNKKFFDAGLPANWDYPIRAQMLNSSNDDHNTSSWFAEKWMYPREGAGGEFARSDINTAITWQTGVNKDDSKDFFAKYEVTVRLKVLDGPYNNKAFSGIIGAFSSWQNSWVFAGGEMNGFRKINKKAETIKVVYREHFNGFQEKLIPKRKVNFVREKIAKEDKQSKNMFMLDGAKSTPARKHIETVFGLTTPVSSDWGIGLDDYMANLNFTVPEVEGYHLRNIDGRNYKLTSGEVDGVKTIFVDVQYDDDIIPASSAETAPDGYARVTFDAKDSPDSTKRFKENENTEFYVRKDANITLQELGKRNLIPLLQEQDLFSWWSRNYNPDDVVDEAMPITDDLAVNANYSALPLITETPPDQYKAFYVRVKFKAGPHSAFEGGSKEKEVRVMIQALATLKAKVKDPNVTIARLRPYFPVIVPDEGYIVSDPAWKYATLDEDATSKMKLGEAVLESDIINTDNTGGEGKRVVLVSQTEERKFDKEHITGIEIIGLKQDYWPNQYFRPDHGRYPFKVRLTDVYGKVEEVSYPDFDDYHLKLYIPKGMEGIINTETLADKTRFVMPADPVEGMVMGVKYELDDKVFAETDPKGSYNITSEYPQRGIFTHLTDMPPTQINVFKANDPAKQKVETVPVRTPINLTIKIPGAPEEFAETLFVKIPGINHVVELKKTTIDGVPVYANVDGAGSSNFTPLLPEISTKDRNLDPVADAKTTITAFGASATLNVLPPVIDRKDNKQAAVEGNDDYVRIVYNPGDGSFEDKTANKVYDVVKLISWTDFIGDTMVPSVTPPGDKVFSSWSPQLPDTETKMGDIKGGSPLTVGNKKINVITYTAQYTDKIVDGDESTQPGQDFVRLTFNSGDGSFGNGIKTKLLDVHTSIHWNDPNLASRIQAIETALTPPQNKSFDGWDPVIPTADEAVAEGSYTARYLDNITVTPPAEGDADKYAELTFANGDHGLVSSDMWTPDGEKKVWVLISARKTFKEVTDFLTVTVSPEENYKHTGWIEGTNTAVTDKTVIKSSMTVTATYEEKKVTIPVIKEWTHTSKGEALPAQVDLSLYRNVSTGGTATKELLKTVTLKPNQAGEWKGEFADVPVSAAYIVEEKPIKGYEMSWTNTGNAQAPSFKVTNRKLPTLTVEKTVPGLFSDHQKEFVIRVSLTKGGKAVSGAYDYSKGEESGQLTFSEAGLAEIRLKHGQSISIKNLPADAAYRVEEDTQSAKGYKVTYKAANSGSLTEDTKVEVINTGADIVPTGIKENATGIGAMALALVLTLASVIGFVKLKERKRFS